MHTYIDILNSSTICIYCIGICKHTSISVYIRNYAAVYNLYTAACMCVWMDECKTNYKYTHPSIYIRPAVKHSTEQFATFGFEEFTKYRCSRFAHWKANQLSVWGSSWHDMWFHDPFCFSPLIVNPSRPILQKPFLAQSLCRYIALRVMTFMDTRAMCAVVLFRCVVMFRCQFRAMFSSLNIGWTLEQGGRVMIHDVVVAVDVDVVVFVAAAVVVLVSGCRGCVFFQPSTH